jgi:hypothetical protein
MPLATPRAGNVANLVIPSMLGRVPDHYRCKAIARMTGERCRKAAMQGSTNCEKHGGYRHAIPKARQETEGRALFTTAVRRPRMALATLGALFGDKANPSIIGRGRDLELTANAISETYSGSAKPKAGLPGGDQGDTRDVSRDVQGDVPGASRERARGPGERDTET